MQSALKHRRCDMFVDRVKATPSERRRRDMGLGYYLIAILVFPLGASAQAPFTIQDCLSLVPKAKQAELEEALKDAGRNYSELGGALKEAPPEEREDVAYLIKEMPHLDRLEMTSTVLLEHVRESQRARKESFAKALPENIYREHLLTYRLDEEPCEAWRKALREEFTPLIQKAKGPLEAAKLVNQWVARRIKRAESRYFGPEQSPLMTLGRKKGTPAEIAVLTTAILRSLGIACRMASLGGRDRDDPLYAWLEVYSAGVWAPLYPFDPKRFGKGPKCDFVPVVSTSSGFRPVLVTERYTQTGKVKIVMKEKGKPLKGFKDFSISVITKGAFKPLDDLAALLPDEDLTTDSTGTFLCILGQGKYLLVAGKRDSDGNPTVVLKEFTVVPAQTAEVELDLGLKP